MKEGKPNPDSATHAEARLLMVDDEPYILNSFRRTLRNYPWELHLASSGEEGLEILDRQEVDVVVSDFMMGGIDGVEFLNRVKQRWPRIQRVMLTGQASAEAIERAINESEVYRFLNKPWHEPQLAAIITDCLEHQRLIEANQRYEEELALRNEELTIINRTLEQTIQERTRALIQSEKMAALGRMSGEVAHEINNPLGGILAFAQVLLRNRSSYDAEMVEMLETIQSCALRCRDIVDRLLSFSRKPMGEGNECIELNGVIRDALLIAQMDTKAKDVVTTLDLSEGDLLVRGQSGPLEQVVVNLLQNAYQASSRGSEVILRTKLEGATVLLEVEDRGCGIPQDALPRIFEPFFTTKGQDRGTGLGLFICYGIVAEYGGDIVVDSSEGDGSTFTVRLPAVNRPTQKESTK